MDGAQLLNAPSCCVDEALEGLLAVHDDLARLRDHRVIARRDIAEWRTRQLPDGHSGGFAVVSGGGAGHEPAHSGLVGRGLLTAAVVGDVFASPPVSSILAALRLVASPRGVLLIVMNYTGDRLNFGLAAERARAEGVPIEMVVVGEDCALTGRDRSAGRRGLAGGVLIEKLAGACAEEGLRPLAEVAAVLRVVAGQMGTISVSLSACVQPGGGRSFDLPAGSMEVGLGIHGEAGVRRVPAVSADATVAMMLDHMTDQASKISLRLEERVVLLVNNLGGLSEVELYVVTAAAVAQLQRRGSRVVRCLAGRMMTSMAMSGVSLTVLNISDVHVPQLDVVISGDQLLSYLDRDADRWPFTAPPSAELGAAPQVLPAPAPFTETDEWAGPPLDDRDARRVARCVQFAARAVMACADQMDQLSHGCVEDGGDGGRLYGASLASVCRAVLTSESDLPADRPRLLLSRLSRLCEAAGGPPGELYALALSAGACAPCPPWLQAARRAVEAVRLYGSTPPGRAPLLWAAEPALQAAERAAAAGQTGELVAQAAAEAAETAALRVEGSARPAAHAVGVWTRAVAEALKLH